MISAIANPTHPKYGFFREIDSPPAAIAIAPAMTPIGNNHSPCPGIDANIKRNTGNGTTDTIPRILRTGTVRSLWVLPSSKGCFFSDRRRNTSTIQWINTISAAQTNAMIASRKKLAPTSRPARMPRIENNPNNTILRMIQTDALFFTRTHPPSPTSL